MKRNKKSVVFWIFTVIAVVCLILSPILAYYLRNIAVGGFLLGGSIIGWLGMIVTEETRKNNEKQNS